MPEKPPVRVSDPPVKVRVEPLRLKVKPASVASVKTIVSPTAKSVMVSPLRPAACRGMGSPAAGEDIRARPAGQHIITAEPQKEILGAIAGQRVGKDRTDQILYTRQRIDPGADGILCTGDGQTDDDTARRSE